jgi:flagellar protein FliL
MSAAAVADAAPPKKGKKKLLVIVGVVLLLLVAGGAVAVVMLKRAQAAAEADGDGGGGKAPPEEHAESKAVPIFVPLDSFTVNLADRDADHYAQVGITLEVVDDKAAEKIKQYMPAIRNNILLALSDKTAAQLMDREGKTRLADQIRRETARALGYKVEDPLPAAAAATASAAGTVHPVKAKAKKPVELPVTAVQFSNFIIQ